LTDPKAQPLRMFIAPMPDCAWDHGFITISNIGDAGSH